MHEISQSTLNSLCAELFGIKAAYKFHNRRLSYSKPEKKELSATKGSRQKNSGLFNNLITQLSLKLGPFQKRQLIISLLAFYNSLYRKPALFLKKIEQLTKIFGITTQELEEFILLVKYDFPSAGLYVSSAFVGKNQPPLAQQLQGLKFIEITSSPFDLWIYKMRGSRYALVRTIRNDSEYLKHIFQPGELMVLDEQVNDYLKAHHVFAEDIISDLDTALSLPFDLMLSATELTPHVLLDTVTPKLEITGRSIMLDADAFYSPVFTWLESFRFNKHTSLHIRLAFDLINTKTCRMLTSLFYLCKELEGRGVKVEYNWIFPSDDPDLKQTGKDMQMLIGARFNFIETESLYE